MFCSLRHVTSTERKGSSSENPNADTRTAWSSAREAVIASCHPTTDFLLGETNIAATTPPFSKTQGLIFTATRPPDGPAVDHFLKPSCPPPQIYPPWRVVGEVSSWVANVGGDASKQGGTRAFLRRVRCRSQTLVDRRPVKLPPLFVSVSLEPPFKLCARFSLSLLLHSESIPPPSGPQARRFFSFSSVRVMNHTCTRKRTRLRLHTRSDSPLLKTVNPGVCPHRGRRSGPFALGSLSVPVPPSRHSEAKRNSCQSKQAAAYRHTFTSPAVAHVTHLALKQSHAAVAAHVLHATERKG